MKINYRKDPGCSYLVIDCEGIQPQDIYAIKLLKNTDAPALLSLDTDNLDGSTQLLYDITGRQSFDKKFETEKLTMVMLKGLIDSLSVLSDTLSSFLLSGSYLLIRPDTIFLDHSGSNFAFCYMPYQKNDLQLQLKELFNVILSVIDYNDKRLVTLAFDLNKTIQNSNFTIGDIISAYRETASGQHDDPEAYSGASKIPGSYGRPSSTDEYSGNATSAPAEMSHADPPVRSGQPGRPRSAQTRGGFFEKAKLYFADQDFSSVIDDINTARIIRKIRETDLPDVPVSYPETVALSNPMAFNEDIAYDASAEPEPIEATASINPEELKFHKLTGIGQAAGINIILDHFPFSIGSHEQYCDFALNRPTVSRLHCRIHAPDSGSQEPVIEDLNSKNGTGLNGQSLDPYSRKPLHTGDMVSLADMEFTYS